MVDGDEKPLVCGVVDGDDESWPESDLEIRPGEKIREMKPLTESQADCEEPCDDSLRTRVSQSVI